MLRLHKQPFYDLHAAKLTSSIHASHCACKKDTVSFAAAAADAVPAADGAAPAAEAADKGNARVCAADAEPTLLVEEASTVAWTRLAGAVAVATTAVPLTLLEVAVGIGPSYRLRV